MSDKRFRVFSLLVMVFGVGLRAAGLNKEPWYDELHSLVKSARLSDLLFTNDHPPLYFLCLKLLGLSHSVLPARLLSLALGAGFIWVVMATTHRFGKEAALTAGVLASGAPGLIRYGIEIRDYTVLVVLTAVAIQLSDRLRKDEYNVWNERFLLLAVCLAALTHAVGVFLGTAVAAMQLVGGRSHRLALKLAGLPVLTSVIWLLACQVTERMEATNWIPAATPGHVLTELAYLVHGFDSAKDMVTPGLKVLALTGLASFLLLSALLLPKMKAGRPYLAGELVYFLCAFWFSVLIKPVLITRTLLPVLVFHLHFLAVEIGSLESPRIKVLARALIACFVLTSAARWLAWNAWQPHHEWREAFRVVSREVRPREQVIVTIGADIPMQFYLPNLWKSSKRLTLSAPDELNSLERDSDLLLIVGWLELPHLDQIREKLSFGRSETLLYDGANCKVYRYERPSVYSPPTTSPP